jgi:hypothetical protein
VNHQGFLVLFRSTSDTIVAGMLLSLAYLKAIQWLAPFKDPALNRIKETSEWQIFFVFLIALLIKLGDTDSDFLVVCLMLAFFANFLILFGQYVVQYCGRYVCVPLSVARHEAGKDKAVELQNVTSLVLPPDTSASVESAVREEDSGSEDSTSPVNGSSGGHHVCVVTGPPPALLAAGSQSQSQSSPSSDMHTVVGALTNTFSLSPHYLTAAW